MRRFQCCLVKVTSIDWEMKFANDRWSSTSDPCNGRILFKPIFAEVTVMSLQSHTKLHIKISMPASHMASLVKQNTSTVHSRLTTESIGSASLEQLYVSPKMPTLRNIKVRI